MSSSVVSGWTETLAEPLASIARGREWRRVEEAPGGGWLLLSDEVAADVSWYRAATNGKTLEALGPFDDDRLPHVERATRRWLRQGHAIRLLAWRVGRRAVFRVATDEGSRICKLYHRDRRIRDRWTALPCAGEPWRVPRVIDWEPELRLLTIEDCSGDSVNRRWLGGRGEPADGDRIAGLLGWLHAQPLPRDLPHHGTEDEVRLLGKRLEAFERTLADPPPGARDLTRRVVAALREDPPGAPVLCHRDFHDKQILLDGERGRLIDLDLVAAGPPALDVGNILAHLRLRKLKGADDLPWETIAARIVAGARADRPLAGSLHRWVAAALMRLTLIYSRRARPADLLDDLMATTDAALGRTGEWSGLP